MSGASDQRVGGMTWRHGVARDIAQRGAKAQPGGRLARSGGAPGIATSRLPLATE